MLAETLPKTRQLQRVTRVASPQRVPKSWTMEEDDDGMKIGSNNLQRHNRRLQQGSKQKEHDIDMVRHMK